jgi:phosphohistidine phosphatase
MKRLTLVRHAKAEDALPGQSDFDRQLQRRGSKDADEMAQRLKHRRPHVDLVLASPAPRAFATAQTFARVLKLGSARLVTDERLYLGAPEDIVAVIREQNDHQHILVVAHNPGVTECADKLSSEFRIESMPTCAIVTMRLSVGSWTELRWNSGTDVETDYPAKPA